MENKNFIMTTDKNTADKLVAEGFNLVTYRNGQYLFVNCPQKMSSVKNEIKNKVVFTNNMCM